MKYRLAEQVPNDDKDMLTKAGKPYEGPVYRTTGAVLKNKKDCISLRSGFGMKVYRQHVQMK